MFSFFHLTITMFTSGLSSIFMRRIQCVTLTIYSTSQVFTLLVVNTMYLFKGFTATIFGRGCGGDRSHVRAMFNLLRVLNATIVVGSCNGLVSSQRQVGRGGTFFYGLRFFLIGRVGTLLTLVLLFKFGTLLLGADRVRGIGQEGYFFGA